jgi:hypothetical protein
MVSTSVYMVSVMGSLRDGMGPVFNGVKNRSINNDWHWVWRNHAVMWTEFPAK